MCKCIKYKLLNSRKVYLCELIDSYSFSVNDIYIYFDFHYSTMRQVSHCLHFREEEIKISPGNFTEKILLDLNSENMSLDYSE